ncbi:MAG: 50S ribosomal protein L11 methyltransferase [Clostridiales bacterium]|nr:50S ribosomal protein L11 methyltransferase [Clostridiales bacterium]
MDWTEITISVKAQDIDRAGDIANMVVPYGIYIEDYRTLEEDALKIARIDLIDQDLLDKDRSRGLIHIYIPKEQAPAEAIAFLTERFEAEGIQHEIVTSRCRNEDWENNWKEFFKPFPVGERLFILPAWESSISAPADGRRVLLIEPGLAFGNGSHETTKLCLQALEPHIRPSCQVLDIGCGSGILSIAALLLGADKALGVDIDALAVKTAKENGKLNDLHPPRYTILEGDLLDKVSGKYDILVANIVADAIITLSTDVGRFLKPDGILIVSGIIDIRAGEVLQALEGADLRVIKEHHENGWHCFEAKIK